jgi:hypothetical protein
MTPHYAHCAAERENEKEAVREPELHGAAAPAPLPSEPELPPKVIPLPDKAPEHQPDPPPQVPQTAKAAA